jgi:hypothetical protein
MGRAGLPGSHGAPTSERSYCGWIEINQILLLLRHDSLKLGEAAVVVHRDEPEGGALATDVRRGIGWCDGGNKIILHAGKGCRNGVRR